MTYSKIHKRFSKRLNKPEALTNPGKYLGPNWEDVLNFWFYIDTLSDEEKKEINDRFWALDRKVRVSAIDDARAAAKEVVGDEFRCEAWRAAWDITGWGAFGGAIYELIAHHKLLEQGKTLTFLPLCVNN
jgi:hypothetical protein